MKDSLKILKKSLFIDALKDERYKQAYKDFLVDEERQFFLTSLSLEKKKFLY